MSTMFRVIKPFNHNVVFCMDEDKKKECILIGKGIGFNAKPKDLIKEADKVEKSFYLVDGNNIEKFNGLTQEIESNIVGAAEEAISMLSKELDKDMDEKIHVSFIDHIAFAIERYNSGIEIKNPFIVEIKTIYRNEYELAIKVLDIINSRLNINLPQDEVGFITMHIHAAVNRTKLSKTATNTAIISEMIKFVEDKIGFEIDKDGIDYVRLVTHLRFALDRAEKNIPFQNLLLSSIRRKFKDSYSISKEMANMVSKGYNINLSKDEIGYLAVHIEKLKAGICKNIT